MSEVATTTHGSGLVLQSDQDRWNEHQLTALRHLLGDNAKHVTPADLDVFHHVCQRTALDPFARQIHLVFRKGKWTIQSGIDGLRLVARRAADASGETMSINGGEWCGPDGVWRDVWLEKEPPAAARVTVTRGAGTFVGTVTYSGYVQLTRDGNPSMRWATDPAGQLRKCAEAAALRMGFPQDLAGVYVNEEMEQADNEAPARQGGLSRARARRREATVDAQAPEPTLDWTGELAAEFRDAIADLGVADDERVPFVISVIDRQIESPLELTEDETRKVIDHIKAIREPETDGKDVVDAEVVPDADTETGEVKG